jgi:hypothetical protein
VLFEDLEFGVGLVKFERDNATNDVGEHVLKGELVTVVVRNRCYGTRVCSLLTLQCCFLTHHTDGFVSCFDLEGLHLTDVHSSDKLSSRLSNRNALLFSFLSSHSLSSKVSSLLSVHETNLVSDNLSLFNVLVHKSLSFTHHSGFVSNTLKLLILQLFGDGVLSVFGHGFMLISLVLLLNDFKAIINFAISQDIIELLQEVVGSMRSAVDNGVIVSELNVNVVLLKKFGQVLPVVYLSL